MGREIKRVPVDFDWPLNRTWPGYLTPKWLHEDKCPDCENGYSPHAQHLFDLWYGYVPFKPADNGSSPLTPETPAVREFAERNVRHSPEFYGGGEAAIIREARRLCELWNGQWSHHLADEDVAALVEAGRLMDLTHTWSRETRWRKIDPPVVPTAQQVNEWSLCGFGHDAINASVVIRARCEREGEGDECPTCQGHAGVEAFKGQRALAEAWKRIEPPTGDGWQLWETVTEGSPISPAFSTRDGLVEWLCSPAYTWGASSPLTREQAEAFVESAWAPSFISVGGQSPLPGEQVVGRG